MRLRVLTSFGAPRLAFTTGLTTLLLSASARGQGDVALWQGLVHESLGAAQLTVLPGGALRVDNLGSSGQDGVRTRVPQADGSGVAPTRAISIATVDPTAALPVGASLEFRTRGPLGGLPDVVQSSLLAERQPNGRVGVVPDFGPLGATTYRVDYYDSVGLVGSDVGLTPLPGYPGPMLMPNCDADPVCCWLAYVTYVGGHWVAVWPCLQVVSSGGGTSHSANRVVITPENPTTIPSEFTGCDIVGRSVPEVTLTAQTLENFGGLGTPYCSAASNSTGAPSVVAASGSAAVADADLRLFAFGLPQQANGYFVVSPSQAFVPNAGASQGNLCVGASTGRFLAQLGNSGATGVLGVTLDVTQLPQPNGAVAIQPGETWNFQCWHRDANPGPTSNFSQALSVLFE